jgi:hypothetical protein
MAIIFCTYFIFGSNHYNCKEKDGMIQATKVYSIHARTKTPYKDI